METESDSSVRAEKSLYIVFLHSDADNLPRIADGMVGADYSDGKGCEPQQREPKAPVNAAKFTATTYRIPEAYEST